MIDFDRVETQLEGYGYKAANDQDDWVKVGKFWVRYFKSDKGQFPVSVDPNTGILGIWTAERFRHIKLASEVQKWASEAFSSFDFISEFI